MLSMFLKEVLEYALTRLILQFFSILHIAYSIAKKAKTLSKFLCDFLISDFERLSVINTMKTELAGILYAGKIPV